MYASPSSLIQFANLKTHFPRLHSATGEFIGLISNWEKAPISAFELSSTSTCSVGYTLLGVPTWPGTYSDACACASGATADNGEVQGSTHYGVCDSNQTEGAFLARSFNEAH